MNQLKTLSLIIVSLTLTGCGEIFHCRNPTQVSFVKQLPCYNCQYKGTIKPNTCPDGTYPHKLQCAAGKLGGNTILLREISENKKDYSVYKCPQPVGYPPPRNDKTDVSNSCNCRPVI